MSNEPVFVAIGLACVVGVLLFIVFIIYCVKRQQDKEQMRLMRQRRAREERNRRHLIGFHLAGPPAYDQHRRTFVDETRAHQPLSPPPEYKETATPLPRASGVLDLDHTFNATAVSGRQPEHNIRTISRNVGPANTFLAENNSINTLPGNNSINTLPGNNSNDGGSSDRYVNRTTITTTISSHIHDTFQDGQLPRVTAIGEQLANRASSNDAILQTRRLQKPHIFSINSEQVYIQTTPRQVLDVASLNKEIANDGLLINAAGVTSGGLRSFYNSTNHSEAIRQQSSLANHSEAISQLISSANRSGATRQLSSPQTDIYQQSDDIRKASVRDVHGQNRSDSTNPRLTSRKNWAGTSTSWDKADDMAHPRQQQSSTSWDRADDMAHPRQQQTSTSWDKADDMAHPRQQQTSTSWDTADDMAHPRQQQSSIKHKTASIDAQASSTQTGPREGFISELSLI